MEGLLVKHIQELLSQIHWFQALYVGGRGLATIDQLLTISLVLVNIGEKITLGLKYT